MTLNFIGSTDIYEDKDSVISEYENAGRNNMNKVKLNLGCGSEVLEGYENYDFFPVDKRVNFIDLSKLPLSFTDNSVDEILLAHTLEHLIDPMSFVMDCHRILKPDGRLVIKVPARGSSLAHLRAYHTVGYMRCVSSSSKESNGHQQRAAR